MKKNVQRMVKEFESQLAMYGDFAKAVHLVLASILKAHNIPVHNISYRVKDPSHLEEKITRPGKKYSNLSAITDLVGLRVVTYFADDVDKVCAIIDREFAVDKQRSVDKRNSLEPDRFGYVSVHKICTLRDSRVALAEYQAFKGLVCEIQVRSILQHAWAEIEHDLGYKAVDGVPVHLRRRFSMLASLLELADDEFLRLRDELQNYSTQVKLDMQSRPDKVLVDNVSLYQFVLESKLVEKLDTEFANALRTKRSEVRSSYIESRVKDLHYAGVRTIKDLSDALEDCQEHVLLLISKDHEPEPYKWELPPGVSLFLLVQLLVTRSHPNDAANYLKRIGGWNTVEQSWIKERAQMLQELVKGA